DGRDAPRDGARRARAIRPGDGARHDVHRRRAGHRDHPREGVNEGRRPMGKLDGKVAVVTGGSSGIGLAAAKRLVADGAYVFITGRRKAELDAAARELGSRATAVQGDVSKLADIDRLFATVKESKGRVDVLFANAGVAEGARLGEITEEHFDRIFDIN